MKAFANAPNLAAIPRRLLAPLAGAAIVLAVGAATTLSATGTLSHHLASEAEARFAARGGYLLASLERRLDDFSNLILGMQGLFIASSQVSREEFRRYSENLNLQQRLPGLQALSFQRRVVRQGKAAFEARVRGDRSLDPRGYPEFAIRPGGERGEYLVIDFIEPMDANLAAFGYDAGTQPANADAIRLARDTGRVQASEPFGIVQSPGGPPRIVLRAPVYRRGLPVATVEQRRAALEGFAVLTVETHASFREYFNSLLMEGERLILEDAGPARGSSVARRTLIADIGHNAGRPLFNKRFNLEFGGRNWELRHSADAAWVDSLPGQGHPDTVLAGGLVISLLLAALYLVMATARNRALALADERTQVLRATQDNMAQGISVVDRDLRLIGHNRRFLDLLGFPASLAGEQARFEDFVRYNAERGEYGPGDIEEQVRARVELARCFEPHQLKRTRPDGTVLEIVGKPLPGGGMVTTYTDITQQERAQEALRRSEQRHRTLVEMSPDAVFVHRDGILQLANPAAARLFGAASPGQLVGHAVRELVAPEDLPRVRERIASLESGAADILPPNEIRYLTLDGRRIEVESLGALIDLEGQPAILTVARDIGERKRTEAALRDSEARFRHIIEQSPLSMAIVASDGRIEFINRKAIDTLGYSPEDIPDMTRWGELAFPDPAYRAEASAQWAGLVEQAIAANHEIGARVYRVTCKDGSVKRVEIFGVPVAGKLLVMFEDVTERELAAARILQERDFRQHLIESIPGVFYLLDQDGRFLLWNRNFETVVGYTPEEMAAAHPLDFFEGDDREFIAKRIGAAFAIGVSSAEALFKSKDGTKRPYYFTGDRITLEDGRLGLVGVGFDISERMRAEETLARQTAILQATLEAMDQGISVVDADLHMNALNRRFCELLEFPESMAREGADFAEFVRYNALRGEYGPGDVEEKVREMVARARQFQPHHFKRVRPNGRIIEIRGRPMPGGGFVTTYTDVTEQEHAQEAIRQSEQRYRNLIDLSPDAVFVHRRHIILIANPAAARLWGLATPAEAIGRNLLDFIHPDSHELVKARIARLESDPTLFRLPWAEQNYLRTDGVAVPVEGSATVIELEDGPALLSVIRDISDRKRAEDNVRRERDFRQHLIESIPGLFYLFDPAGRLLLWNHNLEAVLGRSAEELARLRSIELFDEEDRARVREATQQAQATGSARVEANIVAQGGARIPHMVTGIRIEVDGQPTFIGLGMDITERKLAEQVIRDLNDTLEQRVRERTAALEASNRELESFSYSVSHDLRAPLRALHGFSHLLEEEYAHRLDENGLGYLRRIRAASQRMGDLIDDLINLARVSRQELRRKEVDLSQIAGEIAGVLAEQAPDRAVAWHIAPGIRAHADPLLMRVALENLLGNAWKFTQGTPAAVIEFGVVENDARPAAGPRQGGAASDLARSEPSPPPSRERAAGERWFFVRDNGAGFDAAYADKLFQPFQRLHRPDEFAGTGIGLATVHRIILRHGGRIRAEGAPGRGAAFHFTLP